jgi:hypothetical protein
MNYDKVPEKLIHEWFKSQLKNVEFFCWIGNAPRLPLPEMSYKQRPTPFEILKQAAERQAARARGPKRKYKKRVVKNYVIPLRHKEAPPIPDVKTPIIRPKAVYDNKSPYGIASSIHNE